jgi:agmatine deiminase
MVRIYQSVGSVLTVVVLLCVTFAGATTVSLDQTQDIKNTIYSYSFGSSFAASIRQPAEFEPMQGVLIRYQFGISLAVIKEMAEDVNVVTIVASTTEKNTVQSQYESYGVDISHCSYLIALSDTYWTRDYGPWFIIDEDSEQGIVDFEYNRPRPNDDLIPVKYAQNQSISLTTMALTTAGGNYMTDGQGIAISTNLIWGENPGLTHEEINQMVHDYLGINTYHVVADVNNEYIKHIDCWGKYLSPDTILIREVPSSHSQYDEIEAAVDYFESQMSCYGTPYTVARVYTPNNEPYTNSFILNNKVLVPITGSQWDDEAITSYQDAMPGYEVLGFTGSWESTDALHCRAMGITDRYMLYIEHTPLSDNQQSQGGGYDIEAKIIPYSGQPLVTASTGVYWRVEDGAWNFIPMQASGDDYYHAIIPSQENGTVVSYYIHAEDESGRMENHPYIGEEDAYSFIGYGGEQPPNTPPDQPEKPSGEVSGKIGMTYIYTTQTTDVDGDQVYYKWDWGDGNFSDWIGPFDSGVDATAEKSWEEKGTYSIRVKAKDVYGNESGWSDPLAVTMPCNQVLYVSFLEKLQRWFPNVYLVLMEILHRVSQ